MTASSSQYVSSESNYPDFVPVRTVHIIMCLLTSQNKSTKHKSQDPVYREQYVWHYLRFCTGNTCIRQKLYNKIKQSQYTGMKRKKSHRGSQTKQKFCRGRSLLGQVLPTMVYGLRKEEARAAAILCPLLAALLSLCNTTWKISVVQTSSGKVP